MNFIDDEASGDASSESSVLSERQGEFDDFIVDDSDEIMSTENEENGATPFRRAQIQQVEEEMGLGIPQQFRRAHTRGGSQLKSDGENDENDENGENGENCENDLNDLNDENDENDLDGKSGKNDEFDAKLNITDQFTDAWDFLLGDLHLQPPFHEIIHVEGIQETHVVPDRDEILDTLCSLAFPHPMFHGPEHKSIKFAGRFEESQHVSMTLVRSAVSTYFEFFGGDTFATLDTPTMFLVAKAKFPSENPVEVFSTRREYTVKLARLMIAQRKCIASFNDTDENYFLGSFRQISHRIICLSNIIKSITTMRSVAMIPKNLPHTDMTGKILGDMRAAHRLTDDLGLQATYIAEDFFASNGYRRYCDEVWQPVYGTVPGRPGSYFLHAFKKVQIDLGGSKSSSIKDIIAYTVGNERVDPDNVTILKEKMKTIIERFSSVSNSSFPVLKFNNNLRSFLNGVYDMKTDRFYPHATKPPPPGVAPKLFKSNFPVNIIMDSKYMDPYDFTNGKWFDLVKEKAPAFYSVLSYQYKKSTPGTTHAFNTYDNPEQCLRVALAMLGRLLFEVCELDCGFERFLAMIGIAGVGKTKIAEIFCQLVPNLFKLQANTEETFGYENIIGKDLVIVEEISSGSNISQSFMLQVGSSNGRDQEMRLAVSRKYKTQLQHVITQPLLVVGNSFPSKWNDGQGQVSRRLVALLFDRPVEATERDSQIPQKMKAELPVIVSSMVRAYHSMVRCLGSRSLDTVIPQGMMRDRDEIISTTSEVRKFLHQSSSPIVFYDRKGIRSGMMIPVSVLISEFENFKSRSLHNSRVPITQAEFNSILNITKAKILVINAKDTQSSSGMKLMMGVPLYQEFKIIGIGDSSVERRVPVVWPMLKGFEYKLGERTSLDFRSREPQGYIIGIELNLMGSRFVRESTRLDVDINQMAGDQKDGFKPKPTERANFHQKYAKYNDLFKRINNSASYDIDVNELRYLKDMRTVIQRSFTYRNNSTVDGKEAIVEEDSKRNYVTRRVDAHIVHDQQFLSLLDIIVIDQLFGMPFVDDDGLIVRLPGKYIPRRTFAVHPIQRESKSKNSIWFGFVDIDSIKKGVYVPVIGATHSNRFFRFEVSSLVSRIETYMLRCRIPANRMRYERMMTVLNGVYRAWQNFNRF